MDLSQWEWTCRCCGQRKHGVPDFGYDAPIHHGWAEAGDPDFVVLGKDSDRCTMEIAGQRGFFVRRVLRIPVRGVDADLGFGVWASLSDASFQRCSETYSDADQNKIGPLFGYLANRLPDYPDTLNLKADVPPQDGNRRSLHRLWNAAAGHPLYRDQSEGIDTDRLTELLGRVIPCDGRA